MGDCFSRFTKANPNMTKMLLQYYQQTKPKEETFFHNTTMQLNRNYSARLHVDKNSHGPSYIIALGNYQGGRLWCYDPAGNVPWRLPRGQSHFKGFPTSTLYEDRTVRMFDGEKVVDTIYHKGEEVTSR